MTITLEETMKLVNYLKKEGRLDSYLALALESEKVKEIQPASRIPTDKKYITEGVEEKITKALLTDPNSTFVLGCKKYYLKYKMLAESQVVILDKILKNTDFNSMSNF